MSYNLQYPSKSASIAFQLINKKELKVSRSNLWSILYLCFVIYLLASCKQEEEPKIRLPINSFSMQVNGQVWTPFQSKEDTCTSTYSGQYADLGEIPIYTFYAYRDPAGTADASSENLLRIWVMNVTKPGAYLLDGTYKEDFESYIIS